MDSPVFREMLTQQAQTTVALSPAISGHALIPGSQWTWSVEAYSSKSKEIIFWLSPTLSFLMCKKAGEHKYHHLHGKIRPAFTPALQARWSRVESIKISVKFNLKLYFCFPISRIRRPESCLTQIKKWNKTFVSFQQVYNGGLERSGEPEEAETSTIKVGQGEKVEKIDMEECASHLEFLNSVFEVYILRVHFNWNRN